MQWKGCPIRMWKGIAQLMYLVSHQTFWFNAIDSFHVAVEDPGARSLSSLFADPERILRRFYVFAEEPCKSTITTSEPCSPVFKEAQPRPREQSISLISRIGIFFIVYNVFLLLVIYCCNKASNRIVTRSKELVFYSWKPLSPEVSRLSPYTHAQQHTRTSRTFYIFAVHRPT